MLASALRRHRRDRALHQLEQGLLNPLAADVPGDRQVLRLSGDLVDLVNVDDAPLGPLHIVFRRLEKLEYDVLDILPDIAGLGQSRCVRHGERNVEDSGKCLGQQRLAAAGRADQQDVGLGKFDVNRFGDIGQPLVVVVDRDGENLLRPVLPDDIVVENPVDRLRAPGVRFGLGPALLRFLLDDLHAQLNAFVADVDLRAGYELSDLMLALAAE